MNWNRSGGTKISRSVSLQKLADAINKDFFSIIKIEIFIGKIDSFNIFAQNIDCAYKLEAPHRGGSNKYPQSMFWIENKKNRYTNVNL